MSELNLEVVEQSDVLEQTELSEEQKLISERMGKFGINLSIKDVVYFRNLLNKSEFSGSREAYLLLVATAEITSVIDFLKNSKNENTVTIELTAATIESLNYFIEKKTGTGFDSAQKLFSASMILRQAVIKLRELDEKLQTIKKDQKIKDK